MIDETIFWVKLDPRLEAAIGTKMFDALRAYLETEIQVFLLLKLKLPRIILKAKFTGENDSYTFKKDEPIE